MPFYYEEIDEEWTEARRKDIHQLVAGEQWDVDQIYRLPHLV